MSALFTDVPPTSNAIAQIRSATDAPQCIDPENWLLVYRLWCLNPEIYAPTDEKRLCCDSHHRDSKDLARSNLFRDFGEAALGEVRQQDAKTAV
jgi:hypothetical protein